MAVIKLPSGSFQARLADKDGRIMSSVFATRLEADEQVLKWRRAKRTGKLTKPGDRRLSEFFEEWYADVSAESPTAAQSGWRPIQKQYFRLFIEPVIGKYRLRELTPALVKRVFIGMAKLGKAPQTQRLVYATLHKILGDAVENYQYLTFNPVIRKLKPSVSQKEARHLNLKQVQALLSYVEHRRHGLAIWLQLYLGLRVGEVVALKWEDLDLHVGRVSIRRTFVKKTGLLRDYPKGGKQHSQALPPELLERLVETKQTATSEFVVTSVYGNMLPYRWYLITLKKYCAELELPVIGTHGLRHSTSELYMHHGATRDDLRKLFAHSSLSVTDRYVHDRGTNLEKVAKVIQLVDPNRPRKSTMTAQQQVSKVVSD